MLDLSYREDDFHEFCELFTVRLTNWTLINKHGSLSANVKCYGLPSFRFR